LLSTRDKKTAKVEYKRKVIGSEVPQKVRDQFIRSIISVNIDDKKNIGDEDHEPIVKILK
jgi:hypothetical protein